MLTLALATVLLADGVTVKFVPSGAVAKAGGYAPIRSVMSTEKPASVKKLPDGLSGPRFGAMKFGDVEVGFVLAGDKVLVDANRDGDYTNDAAINWALNERTKVMMGSANVDIQRGDKVGVNFYHFDENDPQRAALKDTMLYYGDYGYEISLTLGDKTSSSFVAGEIGENTSVWVDRNGDGRRSYYREMIRVGKAFNFTGTTYELRVAKNGLALVKSLETLEVAPMPPDLGDGKPVLNFKAKTTDGTDIDFPASYKGKVVLVDFWATWCGPCLADMPNVVAAYEKYHDKGFEILGISFDQANAEQKLKDCTAKYKMPWKQVYEGKYWETTIGRMFDVSSIPFTVLVDGDTGNIIGSGNAIRGANLEKTLEKVFSGR